MPAALHALREPPAAQPVAGALRLVTVLFPEVGASRGDFPRLARALVRSAAACSPDTPLELVTVPPAPLAHGPDRMRQGLLDNWQKMVAWDDAIQAADDGELVGLIDCDTLVVGDLSSIAHAEFDVAVTVRPPWARFPYNSGVVFARVSAAVRSFFTRWREVQRLFLDHPRLHAPLRRAFGGLNQAALGEMVIHDSIYESLGVRLLELPCHIWNCEDDSWAVWNAATKIVHVKSRLRRACLAGDGADAPDLAPLVRLWRRYDAS